MKNLTALVDADNFYVSCERLFQPGLAGKPVVVLSNNDGCVVARSQEVKDMGVKMGTPFFQLRNLVRKHKIAVFSSNYELYGDISARLMTIISDLSAATEIYSIDEAFLEIIPGKVTAVCEKIISRCREWLSIPVKIGVAPTKTLAKAASELVKRENLFPRCKIISTEAEITGALDKLELEDIWGVGRKTAARLKGKGIRTPLELASIPETYAGKHFDVMLSRTVMELKGKPCFALETNPQSPKNMCCSRSFKNTVNDYHDVREAVSTYASEAAARLRRKKLKAQSVSVFILTDRFNLNAPQYVNSASLPMPLASSDTLVIVRHAVKALNRIFKSGYDYKKAGVLLNDLSDEKLEQKDLFIADDGRNAALSEAMDRINACFGANTIVVASSGLKQGKWQMARQYQSAKYTTQWHELLNLK